MAKKLSSVYEELSADAENNTKEPTHVILDQCLTS